MHSKRFVGLMSVATVLLMVLAGFAAVPAGAGNEKFEVVVLFKDSIDEQVIKDNNGKVSKKFSLIPAVVTTVTAKDMMAMEKSDKVKAVEKNHIYSIAKPSKDEKDPVTQAAEVLPWGVDRIDAEFVWPTEEESGYTGAGITVAVIDTGIDKDHPDLVENIIDGLNFVRKKGKVLPDAWDDDNGHGTHCAGIIAAEDNEEGVIGVAPDAGLYAIKVLNRRGMGFMTDIIAGIEHATDEEVHVISMSLGGPPSDSMAAAITAASDAGIVLVGASGNNGDERDPSVIYPAAYADVIAVGATDVSDNVAIFSAYGDELDLVAPGVSIYSTYLRGGYAYGSGTSMACPHVAGVVALLLESDVEPGEVLGKLTGTADALSDFDDKDGAGLVDAEEAVTGEDDTGNDLP